MYNRQPLASSSASNQRTLTCKRKIDLDGAQPTMTEADSTDVTPIKKVHMDNTTPPRNDAANTTSADDQRPASASPPATGTPRRRPSSAADRVKQVFTRPHRLRELFSDQPPPKLTDPALTDSASNDPPRVAAAETPVPANDENAVPETPPGSPSGDSGIDPAQRSDSRETVTSGVGSEESIVDVEADAKVPEKSTEPVPRNRVAPYGLLNLGKLDVTRRVFISLTPSSSALQATRAT